MGKRLTYGLMGVGVGLLPYLAWWALTGKFKGISALCLAPACGNLFVYWAERKGKLKSIEELNRPLTLFPRDNS